ncbi:MAG: hypothetical protein AW07_04326 [Candidatus Accumulibacter sp. SK-11]|nr:MAG: hypothetical protein AW07_04326 [Candidatus Accumulibacter sp. SK-11]
MAEGVERAGELRGKARGKADRHLFQFPEPGTDRDHGCFTSPTNGRLPEIADAMEPGSSRQFVSPAAPPRPGLR